MDITAYDPFGRGSLPVGVRTIQAPDPARGRLFPCEIWYPARAGQDPDPAAGQDADLPVGQDAGRAAGQDAGRDVAALPGAHPLVVFSHGSGLHRRSATFLCSHLASHGYVVAALDHSEVIAPELAARDGETPAQRAARIEAVIASRVPDVRFLLDHLLGGAAGAGQAGAADDSTPRDSAADNSTADDSTARDSVAGVGLDAMRIALVGHSFGGWTVLATPEAEPRVRAVVALGPGGSAHPRPGILPLSLTFEWGRDVPAMYLAAANDVPIPLAGVLELLSRAPEPKRLFVLRRADHQHFLDDVEGEHEALRAMSLPGEAAWIPAAMRPITELCSGEQAHLFARGLTLGHLDATLRLLEAAERFLAGDVVAELAARGVDSFAPAMPR